MKSSKRIVPFPSLSYFLIMMSMIPGERRYPKAMSAELSSDLSMFPEESRSKDRKQFCQSVTYFQSAPKSSNETVPVPCLSNIPNISNLRIPCVFDERERHSWLTTSLKNKQQNASAFHLHNVCYEYQLHCAFNNEMLY